MPGVLIFLITASWFLCAINWDLPTITYSILVTVGSFIILHRHNREIDRLSSSLNKSQRDFKSFRENLEDSEPPEESSNTSQESSGKEPIKELNIPLHTIDSVVASFNRIMDGKYFMSLIEHENTIEFTDLYTSKKTSLIFMYFNGSFVFLFPDKNMYIAAESLYTYESWFVKISYDANRYNAFDFINYSSRLPVLVDFLFGNQTIIPLGGIKNSDELQSFYKKLVESAPPELSFKLSGGNLRVFKNGIPSTTIHKFKKFPMGNIGCYLSTGDCFGYYEGNNYIHPGFYKAGSIVAINKLYYNSPEIKLLSTTDDLLLWYQYFEFVIQNHR